METLMTVTDNVNADAAKGSRCGTGHDHFGDGHHGHHIGGIASVRDPVCGMTVDPATSRYRFDYRGETFHFCSAGCQTKFAADPGKYLDNSEPKATAREGAIYTCPMH